MAGARSTVISTPRRTPCVTVLMGCEGGPIIRPKVSNPLTRPTSDETLLAYVVREMTDLLL
jgi:hypothetical protein